MFVQKITEDEKLHQLCIMSLADGPPVDAMLPAYLFTETPDNQESVLQRSAELFHEGKASHLLLIDNQGGSEPGYPGAPPWQKRLRELKVPKEKVFLIPFTAPVLHTLSEACAMARFVKEYGWNRVIVIAPPFHLPRCFLSTVTAGRHFNPGLRVYNQVGFTASWYGHAVHSQKAVQGLRKDLIVEEVPRIKRYQRQSKLMRLITDGLMFLTAALRDGTLFAKLRKIGQYAKQGSPVPLVSKDDALAYLEWRDKDVHNHIGIDMMLL